MKDEYSPFKAIRHPDKLEKMKNGIQVVPSQVQLIPTNRCNLACEYCFPTGTQVLTVDGYKPIESIEDGERIFDGDGNIQYVLNTFSRKYNDDMISLDLHRLHIPFDLTPEHPVWIKGRGYIEAKNINVGDEVKVNLISGGVVKKISIPSLLSVINVMGDRVRYKGSKKSLPKTFPLNKEVGRLFGYYLAEGHCHTIKNRPNSGNTVWTFHKDELVYIDDVRRICKTYFGIDAKICSTDNTTQITIGSKLFMDLLIVLFGTGSRIKNINVALWNANTAFLDGLLCGYLNGDGCFDDRSFSTTSLGLALSLLNISYSKGISPNLFKSKTRPSFINGRELKSGGDIYTIRFRGNDREVYDKIVGEIPQKIRKGVNWTAYDITDGYITFKVQKIERKKYKGEVYNLSVENSETYIANSVSVHNCAYRLTGYQSNEKFDDTDEIPYEKIVEILDDCQSMGVKAIEVTGGGSPLLHPQIHSILKGVIDRGMKGALVTTGANMTTEIAKTLTEYSWVRFSLDASTHETYRKIKKIDKFQKVLENINYFVSINTDCVVGIGFVVNKNNYKEIYSTAKLAKDLGVDNFRISAAFTPEGFEYFDGFRETAIEMAKMAEELSDENFTVFNLMGDRLKDAFVGKPDYDYCGIKELATYIGANSKVYYCCNLAYNMKGLIGSLENQSFKELWESDVKQKNFTNHNPSKRCGICMFRNKNEFINYCIKPNPKHTEFI